MAIAHVWGNPTTTSGFTGYWPSGGGVYTTGIPFPTGNLDLGGTRTVRTFGFYNTYASGASGMFYRMNYNGVLCNGGDCIYNGIGGVFTFELFFSSGTMYFGRDLAAGRSVIDVHGGSWAGTLAGAFNWATVPTPPQAITLARSGRNVTVTIAGSASNGGEGITAYYVQASSNGGASWGSSQNISSGTYTYVALTPNTTWRFRTFAANGVGNSAAILSANMFVPSGGKRYNGTTWNSTTVGRRFNGSSWVDLTVARRFNGSAWVDLS